MGKLAGLVLFLFSLCSCSCAPPAMWEAQQRRQAIHDVRAASVRLFIDCDGDGVPEGSGSGVIIGPRHIVSARHVALGCANSPTPDMVKFTALLFDKQTLIEVVVDKYPDNPGVDVARFVVSGAVEFPYWAETRDYTPTPGDVVYQYAGDAGSEPFFFKEGYVSGVYEDQLAISIHAVPGNSGSAIYDDRGHVIAILWGGRWSPDREFVAMSWRVCMWKELLEGTEASVSLD